MNVTLEFTLPEEREELKHALHGTDYIVALHTIREKIRAWDKYEDRESIEWSEISNMFWESVEGLELE